MPDEFGALVRTVIENVDGIGGAVMSVHCHNDLGMATANTLSAVKAGASHVECALGGIGERAGMAATEEVVMAIKTRAGFYNAETGVVTKEFFRASKLLQNTVELTLPPNKAIIGDNAFAHEAGIHQHGVMRNPLTYEIMNPQDVGVRAGKLVLGKHSGKNALRERLAELGCTPDERELEEIFARFKTLADTKRVITDPDLEKLVYGKVKTPELYGLVSFMVNCGSDIIAAASVSLRHSGWEVEKSATGETPTIAAFNAIDKIVKTSYPLHYFSIQSISEGRTELGESSVQIWNGPKLVTGRGLATDIVEASIKAYLSAINKALAE
jgi:2-isopropylmalate synthase